MSRKGLNTYFSILEQTFFVFVFRAVLSSHCEVCKDSCSARVDRRSSWPVTVMPQGKVEFGHRGASGTSCRVKQYNTTLYRHFSETPLVLLVPHRGAPVNLTAQSGENSVSAKKRLKNLLYKPIILNSEPPSAQTLQQQLLLLLLLLALRQNGTRDAHKISTHGTMTKRQL